METQFETPQTDTNVETELLSKASAQELSKAPTPVSPVNPVRSVNFILDPSAFTLGLGNIERWFDREYFQSQVKNKNEMIHLNLYIPTYTLHELDYQRRGPIVGSSKASEALKFMDRMLESEDDGIPDGFADSDEEGSEIKAKRPELSHFSFNLTLEHRTHHFPRWSTCERYQIRAPSSQELLHHGKYSLYDEINHVGGGNYSDPVDEELALPARMKHLIRSGVYLTKMNHNGPSSISGDMWKLVTEDPTTKVWASCFGIDCLNINEAELLLFHGKDLTNFEIKPEGADFFSGEDIYQNDAPDSLHKKVNTTSYKYTKVKLVEGKKGKRSGKRATKKPIAGETKEGDESGGPRVDYEVLTEDFNMINFAPRERSTKLVVSKLFAKESGPTLKTKKSPKNKATKKVDTSKKDKTDSVVTRKQQGNDVNQKTIEKKKTSKKGKAHVEMPSSASEVSEKSAPVPELKGDTVQTAQKKPTRKNRKKKKSVSKNDSKKEETALKQEDCQQSSSVAVGQES